MFSTLHTNDAPSSITRLRDMYKDAWGTPITFRRWAKLPEMQSAPYLHANTVKQSQVAGSQIDVGHSSAIPRELGEIGPHAAADLQHIPPRVLRELHHVGHPGRVHPIPMAFHFEVPIERVRL